jgi:hypothetical protein
VYSRDSLEEAGEGEERTRMMEGECQNILCLCMKVTQSNSLKAVEKAVEGWGKEKTMEVFNLISVEYVYV